MPISNFKELKIWVLGKEITTEVYKVTKTFPKEELFGIVSQIRRAAVSIPSNIAEGFNRNTRKEFGRFLYIALGSCAELETQIEISKTLGYIGKDQASKVLDSLVQESKMIRRLASEFTRD